MTPQAAFTLDLGRCTGCAACAIACSNENEVGEGLAWRRIHTWNAERLPGLDVLHYSLACNHCAEPACLAGCPARAYTKDPTTGAVLLDRDRCIGCGYCAWVCPYDAPQYNRATGTMEKCTFCSHRLADGREPACVSACPVEALGFERDGRPGGHAAPGFPDTGIGPAIRIALPRPRTSEVFGETAPAAVTPARPRRETFVPSRLVAEWPLLVFSLAAVALVAWFAVAQLSAKSVEPWIFTAAGAAAMAISTAHLGRPLRAWRALAGLGSSWVSREIACFSAFFFLGAATAWLPRLPAAVGFVAAVLGVAALGSIDMVYRVRGQRVAAVPHAAMTTLTAAYLIALALFEPWAAIAAGLVKLALYPWRDGPPFWFSALRLGTGFVAPALLALATPAPSLPLLLAGPVVGEILERVRFYAELEFLTPAREIERRLNASLPRPVPRGDRAAAAGRRGSSAGAAGSRG